MLLSITKNVLYAIIPKETMNPMTATREVALISSARSPICSCLVCMYEYKYAHVYIKVRMRTEETDIRASGIP